MRQRKLQRALGNLLANAVRHALGQGGRWLLDIRLSGVAAWLAGGAGGSGRRGAADGGDGAVVTPSPPRARAPRSAAAALGEHTDAVLRELTGTRPGYDR